jgi:hypothetical protein
MYVFYTIPLTWSTSQVDPETIAWLFPDHSVISDSLGVNVPELISGLASSIIWSFFFMMCPQVFKVRHPYMRFLCVACFNLCVTHAGLGLFVS